MELVSATAKFLLDPFNVFLLIFLITTVVLLLKMKKAFNLFFTLAIIWILVASTPFLPHALLKSLEQQYLPLTDHNISSFGEVTHIIILGGGHGFNDKLPANSQLTTKALSRLNEGVRLHRLIPGSKLILSGFASPGKTTQAEMLQAAAINIGVKPENTLLQSSPSNTYEEAKVYSEMFAGAHDVIVVTSAAHVPRAVMLFEKCGIDISVSPTNYRIIDPDRPIQIWPSIQNIEQMRIALYEYAGIFRDGYREC